MAVNCRGDKGWDCQEGWQPSNGCTSTFWISGEEPNLSSPMEQRSASWISIKDPPHTHTLTLSAVWCYSLRICLYFQSLHIPATELWELVGSQRSLNSIIPLSRKSPRPESLDTLISYQVATSMVPPFPASFWSLKNLALGERTCTH